MAGRFSIEAVFKAIDKVTAPVSRMQNRVLKFTRKMERGFNRVNRVVGKFTTGIKRAALVGAASLVSMGFALRNLITSGAEFGRAIGSAAAKFPDKIKRGTKEFKALEIAAREVGATTEFTATQAANGLKFLAKAGFDAKFSTKVLADIVDFATASEIELAEASDIASDALGAFGLDSDDLGKKMKGMRRVMDVMSLTANSTNTSVSELFESVKKGGPVAIAAGSDIETFSAMMGILAGSGIKASDAGTAAKNVMLGLAGVGNKAAVTFEKLGIKLRGPNDKLRDQVDVLDDLRDRLKDVKGDKLGIIKAIFGKLPIASAAILIGKAGEKVRGLRKDLKAAGESSKRTAAFIRDDVKGSIDGLTSSIEGVKISIFSLNEGPLKKAIDQTTEWVRTNEKLIASKIGNFLLNIINNLENIITWIKRIGIALAVFFTFATVIKTITLAMTAFNLVMMLNPMVRMVIGVVALTTALAVLISKLEIVQKLGSSIGELAFDLFNEEQQGAEFIGAEDIAKRRAAEGANVVTPQERIARSIEEQRTTSTTEVTIKDDTGRAEITGGKLGPGLKLQATGAL